MSRPTEARHPAARGLQAIDTDAALSRLLEAQIAATAALRPALPALARAAEAAAGALRSGGRLIYVGAGSSGLMALADALELPGTFGIAADRCPVLFAGGTDALLRMTGGVEDEAGLGAEELARLTPGAGDVAICVSASGGTPYTLAVARGLRAAGATVIGIANVPGAPLLTLSDIPVLLDTGAEVVAGSTRMGAATAQKIALNLISTGVGLRLGHVHDGHMVNLTADNAKLKDRAARIVADIAGCDEATARAALGQTDGAAKLAVLVARGADPALARRLLDQSGGHLGPAMTALTA